MKLSVTECETDQSGATVKVATHDNDNQKLPATRAEAKATGSKRYFTGKACVHGHADPTCDNKWKLSCLRI